MTFDQRTRIEREAGRMSANDSARTVFDVVEEDRELRILDPHRPNAIIAIDRDDTPTGHRHYDPSLARKRREEEKARMQEAFVIKAQGGPDLAWRLKAGIAHYSSNRYRGQHANDNQDWPLKKLLNTEGNDHCLALAERYRAMHDAANEPYDLIGKDIADNIYMMSRADIDEATGRLVDKGIKKVIGKKARLETAATRSVAAAPDKTRKRAKPIPRQWNGDWPLLNHIDACRELSRVQVALGWLREAFEAAVVGGDRLEDIGRAHGAGNVKGAMGAGRALVFLGFQAVDEFWQRRRMAA